MFDQVNPFQSQFTSPLSCVLRYNLKSCIDMIAREAGLVPVIMVMHKWFEMLWQRHESRSGAELFTLRELVQYAGDICTIKRLKQKLRNTKGLKGKTLEKFF